MKTKMIEIFGEVKSLKKGKITVIASDETVDRQGETIKASGWDLKNFKKNPVMLLFHDYNQLPVGKWEVKVSKGQLIAEAEFADTDRGREVQKLVDDGIMNAVSVGFMPTERDVNDNSVITKAELLEISWVPVPANPSAIRLAYAKGYKFNVEKSEEALKDEALLKHYREIVKEYRRVMKDIRGILDIKISEKDGAEVKETEQIKTVFDIVTDKLKSSIEDTQKAQNESEVKEVEETPQLSEGDIASVVKEVIRSEISKYF